MEANLYESCSSLLAECEIIENALRGHTKCVRLRAVDFKRMPIAHEVPVVTAGGAGILMFLASCTPSGAREPLFDQTQVSLPHEASSALDNQDTSTAPIDSGPNSGGENGQECLPGEEVWCSSLADYAPTPSICSSVTTTCQALACNRLTTFRNYYPDSMDCLRTVCPRKYSDRYVNCAKDMAYEQASCLESIILECTDSGMSSCLMSPQERKTFMFQCLG
jgi:hypothetical protein